MSQILVFSKYIFILLCKVALSLQMSALKSMSVKSGYLCGNRPTLTRDSSCLVRAWGSLLSPLGHLMRKSKEPHSFFETRVSFATLPF